jgi:hypothetical protein
MRYFIGPLALFCLAGCVATVVPPRVEVAVPAPEVYVPAPPPAVVSVYVEPPVGEPPPIAVGWAPPAMLVESPPPPPFTAAVWVGGYWVWQGNWVWAHGHWLGPPQPGYGWVHPYYENRDGVVIFIGGHWSPPGVVFVPPPLGIHLTVEVAAVGVVPGPRPIGPSGVFIPAPPGSRPGIIVPAPIGTAPAVVTGAPPVVAPGMRVTANVNSNNTTVRNTTVINNVTNVTNVTIVAPPQATANHQAVNTSVPASAHLAAAQPAVFKAVAPEPASTRPIPNYRPGQGAVALPPSQKVGNTLPPPRTALQERVNPPAGAGAPAPGAVPPPKPVVQAAPPPPPKPAVQAGNGGPKPPPNGNVPAVKPKPKAVPKNKPKPKPGEAEKKSEEK